MTGLSISSLLPMCSAHSSPVLCISGQLEAFLCVELKVFSLSAKGACAETGFVSIRFPLLHQ